MKKFFILIICIVSLSSLHAFKYRISVINYNVNGDFSESVLENKVTITKDRLFDSEDELNEYLDSLKIDFLNTRLCNSVDIEYYEDTMQVWEKTFDEKSQTEEIIIPIFLIIKITETGNFIVVPYPKFDSNTGFQGKIKFRHNNFLGRMAVFNADVSYTYSTEKQHLIGASTDFVIPFYLGITQNAFYTNCNIVYNFSETTFNTDNFIGLKTSIPLSILSFDIAFEQHYSFIQGSEYIERGIFSLPISLETKNQPWIIAPQCILDYLWSPDSTYQHNTLISPFIAVSSDTISWLQNFRKGWNSSSKIGFNYSYADKSYSPYIQTMFTIHYPLAFDLMPSNVSPSHRISYWNTFSTKSQNGSYIRGIKDNEYESSSGIILNNDITISLFQMYIDTLTNVEKLELFNFEFQLSPFLDLGLLIAPAFQFDFTTGISLIVHPLAMKSIQLRATFAANPDWENPNKNYTSPYELYIGLGLFY